MAKLPPVRVKHGPQAFVIEKGLTRAEALTVARERATRDFRGFTYNPKTGRVVLT